MDSSTTSSSPTTLKFFSDYGYQKYTKSLPPSPQSSTKRSASSRASSSPSRHRAHSPPTAKELMRLLAAEQDTTRDLEQELSLTTSQLAFEQDRADTAERKAKEAVTRFKDANDTRLTAQADVARLTEELRLYKIALEDAQKEIFKAQNILQEVETRRREAEEEASKLRSKLRKMNEEKLLEIAREEGRKEGCKRVWRWAKTWLTSVVETKDMPKDAQRPIG
ncbi:hypothetical protein BU15DRAFT_41690 [Melanogaster broomeanus]|nr:hypothetical protein BU15DRAFT_41690 [Melanogaster broomeanus]